MNIEPRFQAILAEQEAADRRVIDEALAAKTIAIRVIDRRMTIGRILELASALVASGYAVQLLWIRDGCGDVVGITIEGTKTRAGA